MVMSAFIPSRRTPRSVNPDPLGRKRRHLAHGIFQREHLQIADVAAEHAHERPVTPRMRTRLAEDRDLAADPIIVAG